MEPVSFRQILNEFLEEKTPDSPLKTETQQRPEPTFFIWHASGARPKARLKSAYPSSTKATKSKTVTQELTRALSDLSPEQRTAAERLIALGALELQEGLTRTRLKKGHRRLVKVYHPDCGHGASADRFMEVQRLYECLLDALNESADGNGSASARDCRRPSAA